jgi:hypothetical protein
VKLLRGSANRVGKEEGIPLGPADLLGRILETDTGTGHCDLYGRWMATGVSEVGMVCSIEVFTSARALEISNPYISLRTTGRHYPPRCHPAGRHPRELPACRGPEGGVLPRSEVQQGSLAALVSRSPELFHVACRDRTRWRRGAAGEAVGQTGTRLGLPNQGWSASRSDGSWWVAMGRRRGVGGRGVGQNRERVGFGDPIPE